MSILTKGKKLYEHDPEELDLETLSELQASLIAKLFLVNQELISRYKNVTDLSSGLPGSANARTVLSDSADHLEKVNTFLQAELARITGKTM
jgi:hypothetical protein